MPRSSIPASWRWRRCGCCSRSGTPATAVPSAGAGRPRAHARYHGQAAALLVGLALPWIGNAVYLLGGARVLGGVDPTPLAFALTGLVYAVGLFKRSGLFDLVPVARHALIEGMADGVLV